MNKRIRKKIKIRSLVNKRIKDLVKQYGVLHNQVDTDTFGLGYDEVNNKLLFIPQMPQKEYQNIKNICKELYILTERIISPECEAPEWKEYNDYHCNYRYEKVPRGEYVSQKDGFERDICGYFVRQRTVLGDFYEGTVWIPVKKNKYLAFDYQC